MSFETTIAIDPEKLINSIIESGKITPELKRLRDRAYQRIKQLNKSNSVYREQSTAYQNIGGSTKFNLSPRNKNFADEIKRMVTFLNDTTSTVKGTNLKVQHIYGKINGEIKITATNIGNAVREINATKWDLESRLKQYLESGQNFLSSLGSAERQSTVDSFLKELPNRQGDGDFEELLQFMGEQERAEQLARQLKNTGTFIIPE
ncbi:MAG: hypothetical protein ACRCSJ_06560 [Cetobacterium sp.]